MSAVMSIPNGCVIGLAEEIAQAIARCEYGPKKNHLAVLAWASFKQAGRQKGPQAGLRYFFDMDAVCQELHTSRRSVANMRRQLEYDGLFTYHPNQQNYRTGWIVWNTAYPTWKRLQADVAHYGGKRAGAGNPIWIETARRTRLESTEEDPLSSGVRPVGEAEKTLSSGVRPVDIPLSSGVRQFASPPFKSCPVARSQAAPDLPAIVEPNKGTEERDEEKTYYVADATNVDTSVDNLEEREDAYPLATLFEPAKPTCQASHSHAARRVPGHLAAPQVPANEGLQESEQQEEENAELSYYRELLIKQRRQLKDEQDYLGLCEPAARAGIQRTIEMYAEAVTYTEQMLLDMRPAPPLDESNWQQQLFGGLCKLLGVSQERVTGTPLAGTLGQAANKIKAHKRRPDELPSMWHRFRTDARFCWMNGRGDAGKLMMLFANNAAVL